MPCVVCHIGLAMSSQSLSCSDMQVSLQNQECFWLPYADSMGSRDRIGRRLPMSWPYISHVIMMPCAQVRDHCPLLCERCCLRFSTGMEFNTLDATLLVILRLSNVVVANNTLSIIPCIEEWEESGQPEQVTGHEITGRRVQRWIHPRGERNHDKGDGPRAMGPCVDREIKSFFGVCQEAA